MISYFNRNSFMWNAVQKIMWELIEDKLRKHFKGLNITPSDIFIIDISDKKYYVELDPQHRYGYLKFNFKGEHKGESLKLEGNIFK